MGAPEPGRKTAGGNLRIHREWESLSLHDGVPDEVCLRSPGLLPWIERMGASRASIPG